VLRVACRGDIRGSFPHRLGEGNAGYIAFKQGTCHCVSPPGRWENVRLPAHRRITPIRPACNRCGNQAVPTPAWQGSGPFQRAVPSCVCTLSL